MSLPRPFYRTIRSVRSHPNARYSARAFVTDPEYAEKPEHYVRAWLLIQEDLKALFEYVEPSPECLDTYSYRIHALLIRTCIEVEANFKAIFSANNFTPPKRNLNIRDYRKVDATHHLSSYDVILPMWNEGGPGTYRVWTPFGAWRPARGQADPGGLALPWYQAYNASKHDRLVQFKQANLRNLMGAVTALVVLISSQFADQDFARDETLSLSSELIPFRSTAGSFFRVKYPDDWSDDELYEFDWAVLRNEEHRFDKHDYDAIPL